MYNKPQASSTPNLQKNDLQQLISKTKLNLCIMVLADYNKCTYKIYI